MVDRVALVITRIDWFVGLFTGELTARIAVHQHKVNQVFYLDLNFFNLLILFAGTSVSWIIS